MQIVYDSIGKSPACVTMAILLIATMTLTVFVYLYLTSRSTVSVFINKNEYRRENIQMK